MAPHEEYLANFHNSLESLCILNFSTGLWQQEHSPECLIGILPEVGYFNKEKIEHVADYPQPMVNILVKTIN